MKRKLLSILLILTIVSFSGCEAKLVHDESKVNIVVISFHEYDWVSQIIEGNEDDFVLTILNDSGVDLHNYEPSVEEVAFISSADLFIYNGGTSDLWASEIIENPINPDLISINLTHELGLEPHIHDHDEDEHAHEDEHEDEHAHEEDHDEDEHEDEHAHEEDHDEDEHEDEHAHEEDHDEHEHEDEHAHEDDSELSYYDENDEHIWLSLNKAVLACEVLEDTISDIDEENKDLYEANLAEYIVKLEELDAEYDSVVANASRSELIFPDRFPFTHLVSDYNLEAYAAFSGCSAETEASFETISLLSEKINELDAKYVIILENSSKDLAETVISSSDNEDCEILELNSIQSINKEDIDSGMTYLSIMESNLIVLEKALSE